MNITVLGFGYKTTPSVDELLVYCCIATIALLMVAIVVEESDASVSLKSTTILPAENSVISVLRTPGRDPTN